MLPNKPRELAPALTNLGAMKSSSSVALRGLERYWRKRVSSIDRGSPASECEEAPSAFDEPKSPAELAVQIRLVGWLSRQARFGQKLFIVDAVATKPVEERK